MQCQSMRAAGSGLSLRCSPALHHAPRPLPSSSHSATPARQRPDLQRGVLSTPDIRCRSLSEAVGSAPPGLRPEPWTGTKQQQEALESLRTRMAKLPYGAPSDDTLRWYLRDRYFDVQEAEEKLTRMLKWRQDFQPGSISSEMVAREYASGKAYIHKHADMYGRPALVVRTQKHVTGEYPLVDSKRLCVYLIDQAIASLGPSQASSSASPSSSPSSSFPSPSAGGEQIVGIFDLRGFSVTKNADFTFARFMIEAFFEYYPRRVGQVLMVDAPWVFGPAWEVIRPLMRKYAALVRFVSVKELRDEFFTPGTVPPEFK